MAITNENVVATLTADYNNMDNTPSAKVEYNMNSLQTSLADVISAMQLRGTITLDDVGRLSVIATTEGQWARVPGVGLFTLAAAGSNVPDGTTIFASSDPSMLWYIQSTYTAIP